MKTLIIKRLLQLIPTLLGVTVLTFVIIHLTPGDPVKLMMGPEATAEQIEAKRVELGFDKPLVIQYFTYLGGILTGDLGTSITQNRPVTEAIFARLPATIELAVVAMFFAMFTGVLVGVISAVKPRSWFDNISRIVIFVFLAMPSFWLGLELIIIGARVLEIFPPAGRGEPYSAEMLRHLILPAITLGVSTGAFLCRILRSSMLQVLHADYIRTARAKGLDEPVVIMKHALKNALIPFVTVAGLSLGALLGGSVIVETIFNWPGIGKLVIDSIKSRDYPVTMGCVLVLATIFVFVNLIVDLLYAALDPRIRVGAQTDE